MSSLYSPSYKKVNYGNQPTIETAPIMNQKPPNNSRINTKQLSFFGIFEEAYYNWTISYIFQTLR